MIHQKRDLKAAYNIQGEMRGIGNVGSSVEVLAILILLEGDVAIGNFSTVEDIETLHLQSLFEIHTGLARQAIGLDLCLALHGDTQCLIVVKPDIESGESIHVLDLNRLANVDNLVLVVIGLGEHQVGERDVGFVVFEIHLALECIDIGLDTALGGNCGVDFHDKALALGLKDMDTLDVELGFVHLVLGDLRYCNEDTVMRMLG